MPTINAIDPATATGKQKELFDLIEKRTGRIPNMMRLMVNSPASVNAYIAFAAALRDARLSPETQDLVAVTVAEANGCDYTLAAMSALARKGGRGEKDLTAARAAKSENPKTAAALRFAAKAADKRGHLEAADVAALREAGFSDGEVVEIIAVVALNTYRSYFNLIARPELDFPPVQSAAVTR